MGFGDINSLIRFRDQNPEVGVKAVMMVYNRPPFAIVGRASRGISEDIESLRGKRFGAPAPDAPSRNGRSSATSTISTRKNGR